MSSGRRQAGKCFICGEQTSSSGDPCKWPIWLGWPGGEGKTRCYCTGCVILKVNDRSEEQRVFDEAKELVEQVVVQHYGVKFKREIAEAIRALERKP